MRAEETVWDACTMRGPRGPVSIVLGTGNCRRSRAASRNGSRLEMPAAGSRSEVLLLDEPDNYLRRAGQALARAERRAKPQKTVLLVSHDRELLAGRGPQS